MSSTATTVDSASTLPLLSTYYNALISSSNQTDFLKILEQMYSLNCGSIDQHLLLTWTPDDSITLMSPQTLKDFVKKDELIEMLRVRDPLVAAMLIEWDSQLDPRLDTRFTDIIALHKDFIIASSQLEGSAHPLYSALRLTEGGLPSDFRDEVDHFESTMDQLPSLFGDRKQSILDSFSQDCLKRHMLKDIAQA